MAAEGNGAVELDLMVDAAPFRNRRVRFTVQVRLDGGSGGGAVQVREVAVRPGGSGTQWDHATSELAATSGWTPVAVALDVPADAVAVRLELSTSTTADVSFKDPALLSEPSGEVAPRRLSAVELSRLESLGLLVGYLRYFHPSDEAAGLDWHGYEVEAVRRILGARDAREVRRVLTWVTAMAAPTAAVYAAGEAPPPVLPQRAGGTSLTRWIHIGFGDDDPYATFRDGLSEPSYLEAVYRKTAAGVPVRTCKHVVVDGRWQVLSGAPIVALHLRDMHVDGARELTTTRSRLEVDISAGTPAIEFGFGVKGHGAVGVERVALSCDGREVAQMAPAERIEPAGVGFSLYSVKWSSTCGGRPCIRVERPIDDKWVGARDIVDVDLGNGLRLRMPTALWRDSKGTFPRAAARPQLPAWTRRELAARVAAVLDIWSTVRWFDPNFDDQGIRWDDALDPALTDAGLAGSPDALELAAQRFVAKLQDNHAKASSIGSEPGTLPFFLRRIGDEVFVVHGIGSDATTLAPGTKLVGIDGVDIGRAVSRALSRTSMATKGWGNHFLTMMLGYGRTGDPIRVRALEPNGTTKRLTVARVSINTHWDEFREHHLPDGTELAPGVIYVDLDHLGLAGWSALAPKVEEAKTIVFDMRGYIGDAAWLVIQQLARGEVRSPEFVVPVVDGGRTIRYEESHWSEFPKEPHISARAIFLIDGRTVSAAETVIHMVRAGRLGILVGEPTSGMNGNVVTFESIGFHVRFTGMRVRKPDGTPFDGRGFVPDVTAHPTKEGFLAGRDEILEAAIKLATKP